MRKMVMAGMLLAALVVSACNTIAGAGRDISAAGDAVAKTAQSVKP